MQAYKFANVRGLDVFYRDAGPTDAPVVVLLHGFPSSSHMFRDLIPMLADRFRVIAPDLVGFGYSARPKPGEFDYTFDNLSAVVEELLFDTLALQRFALYVQDYGAPVGFRIASRRPQAIEALVVQNGNAYVEGLSEGWAPIRALWARRDATTEEGVRDLLSPDTTKFQYTHGARDVSWISPDAYTVDQYFLDRAGNEQVQIALFADYQSNLAAYPEWQAYFRERQPPTLLVWGEHDPFFTVEGAKAFARDLPHVELHLLDAGHFALEDHADAIAAHMRRFLDGAARRREEKSITAVLVHAAWADGSSWHKVTGELHRRGFNVVAAQIPLTSLTDDVASLKRVIRAQNGPLVMVGHSYGGAVITAAATGEDTVTALVYVTAMAPDEGESVGDLFYRAPQHPLAPQIQPDSAGFVRLDAGAVHRAVAQDASFEEVVVMAASQKPVSVRCMGEPMSKPAWKEKPSWYFVAERDRLLSPDTQRFMAGRAGSVVASFSSDHMPLLSRPHDIVALIEQAVAARIVA